MPVIAGRGALAARTSTPRLAAPGPANIAHAFSESIGVAPSRARVPGIAELKRMPAEAQKLLFSQLALEEAASIKPQTQLAGREQVKGLVLSIDDASTRDLDNAISFRKERDGSMVVGLHAVDMASVLRLGGPLDFSARQRVETQYLKNHGLTLYMIPKSLAEGTLSLFEGKPRLTKSVEMTFAPDGTLKGHRIFNSTLVNRFQLTTEGANEALAGRGRGARHPELAQALNSLSSLSGASMAGGQANAGATGLSKMWSYFTERSARLVADAISAAGLETSFRNQPNKNSKSSYGHHAQGHASIGAAAYSTWTAGMRRYADVEVQRAMDRVIGSRSPEAPKALRERAMRDIQHGRANGNARANRRDGVRAFINVTRRRDRR